MDPFQNSTEQDSVVAENHFQQIISEIKASFPIWDEFIFKTGKLQTSIKSLVVMLGSFLETFHKLADIASGTKGGYINEMGVGLAKLGFRQRGIEDKLRSLINALSESLMGPTQEKLEEWKKTVVNLDKDHKAEFKRAQQDVKKSAAETLKLKKKVKKGCKPEVQKQLENSMSEHRSKMENLEHIKKSFLRSAVGFSRGQFCHLIASFRPLVDIQLSMMTDLTGIQETMDVLIVQSLSPPPTSAAAFVTNPPPSPDTSKGSYQDLFPGKPPTHANTEESRKSSVSSSSSTQNNVPSPLHLSADKEAISKKDGQQLAHRQHHPHHHHQHQHSCTSYESIKQQPLSPQQQQQQQQLIPHCHHHHNHGHHHHHHHHQQQQQQQQQHHQCQHRSPGVPSPSASSSSSSSSTSSTSPPPPPPLLATSSSLPSSPIRAIKTSAVTFPSPPPECTCGLNVTAKSVGSPYALPLYIGEGGCTGPSVGQAPSKAVKVTSDYTKLFCADDGSKKNDVAVVVSEGGAGSLEHQAATSKSKTVLTLEGYVKMNQLASYYVSKHGDANIQSSLKKDLSSLQTLKFFKEITTNRPAKTAEDVLDRLKQGMTGQSQQPAPRRSNLRDRSLPPSNRKNMRVQFVHQTSTPLGSLKIGSPISSPVDRSSSMTRDVGEAAAAVAAVVAVPPLPSLPPLPPPEMLKQAGCFDDVTLDDLPLPPPPEELS